MSTTAVTRDNRALLLGASGAVGSALTRELLASPREWRLTAFVRRASPALAQLPGAADRLRQHDVAMETLERDVLTALAGGPRPTAAFCTLGVGQPRKVSPEEHRRVDVDYVTAFARACRSAGVEHFSLLTSAGASSGSRSRYLRVKGDVEAAVRGLEFERVSFFRPALLVTRELRYGWQDWLAQRLSPLITPLLRSRFHEIRVEDLARAMRVNAEHQAWGVELLHYAECMRLLRDAGEPAR